MTIAKLASDLLKGLVWRNKINEIIDYKQDLLSLSDPQDLMGNVLLGAGNLHAWFERQYNHAVNSATAGANKRVSIAYCGDSTGSRCAGWFGYFAQQEYGYLDGNGLGGGPPLVYEPVSYQTPSGPLDPTTTGTVTAVTTGYQYWMTGNYRDIGAGATVKYAAQPCTVFKVCYIKEPGAGTFVIETSPDGTTWTQQGAAVDASNASIAGAVATRSFAFAVQNCRIRNTHGSASVKSVGVYLGHASSVRGFDGMGLDKGGLQLNQFCSTPAAVYLPILSDLNPSLMTFQMAGNGNDLDFEGKWTSLMAILRAGNPSRSVLFLANGYSTTISDSVNYDVMHFLRSKVKSDNIAVVDLLSSQGSAQIQSDIGWPGDGVHRNERAYAYSASQAYLEAHLGTRIGKLGQDVRNQQVETNRLAMGTGWPSYLGNEAMYPFEIVPEAALGFGSKIRVYNTDVAVVTAAKHSFKHEVEVVNSGGYGTATVNGQYIVIAGSGGAAGYVASTGPTGQVQLQGGIGGQGGAVQFYYGATNTATIGFDVGNDLSFRMLNGGNAYVVGGNIGCSTAGKGLTLKSGAGARAGNATLVAGTVTIAIPSVSANSIVILSRKTIGGTAGNLTYTISAGASITINSSSGSDTSVVSYLVIELT